MRYVTARQVLFLALIGSVAACEEDVTAINLVIPDIAAQLGSCTQGSNIADMQVSLYISGHHNVECPLTYQSSSQTFVGVCEQITVSSRNSNMPRYAVVLYKVPDPHNAETDLLVGVLAQVLGIWVEDLQPEETERDLMLDASMIVFNQIDLKQGINGDILAARDYAMCEVMEMLGLSLDIDGDLCGNIYELCEGDAWDAASDDSACGS